MNCATAQVLGQPRDEIIGETWSRAIHGTDQPLKDCLLVQAQRTKRHAEGEVYVRERRVWLEASADPVLNEKGDSTGAIHIVRDITNRRRREAAMREREKKYKDLFENAREAILLIDLRGKITAVNRLVEEYGFQRQALIGKRLFNFVVENHKTRAIADFQILLGGKPVKGEMEVLAPKGVFCTEYRDNPIIRGGQVVGVQVILTDITERRRAEEAYRNLVDHSLQGLVIFQDGRAVFVNQAMAEIAGYTTDEILAMSVEQIRDFVHPEDREIVWQNHRRRLAGEPLPEPYEMRGIRKDGLVCWLDLADSRSHRAGQSEAHYGIRKRDHSSAGSRSICLAAGSRACRPFGRR